MNKIIKTLSLACGILFVLASCDLATPVEFDKLAPEMAAVYCEQLSLCCSAAEKSSLARFTGSDCAAFFESLLEEESDLVDMRVSIASGKAIYDPSKGGECIQHMRSMNCADWSAFLREQQAATGLACLNMIRGRLPLHAACDEGYECESGACDARGCAPAIKEGEPCSAFCEDRFECTRCESGLLCQATELMCYDGMPPVERCVADAKPAMRPLCNGIDWDSSVDFGCAPED